MRGAEEIAQARHCHRSLAAHVPEMGGRVNEVESELGELGRGG